MGVAEVLAGNVRHYAARYKVTQAQMAEVLGLSQAAVSKRTRAIHPFSVEDLLRLSRFFNVPLYRLLEGITEAES